jgi:hypothetical protein
MSNPRLSDVRATENLHIVFWLLKDFCWAADWQIPAMLMIVPTLCIAMWLAWKSRSDAAEFLHSAAVVCWISANSVWMTGELFFDDTWRTPAKILFAAGIVSVAVHYLIIAPRRRRQMRVANASAT